MRHDPSRWADLILSSRYGDMKYPPWKYYRFNNQWMYVRRVKGPRVLEVGAGTGLACAVIKIKHPDWLILASDVDERVCRLMVRRFKVLGLSIPVVRCSVFSLPFPDHSFDTVFNEGTLEHFSDEEIVKALREMGRVGKRIVIDVPIQERIPDRPVGYGDERHLHPEYWKHLAEKAGLKVVEEYDREVSPDGRVIRWGMTLKSCT